MAFSSFICLADRAPVKLSTIQSSYLTPAQITRFPLNTEIYAEYVGIDTGHYKAIPVFDKDRNPWYFFKAHWKLSVIHEQKLKQALPYANKATLEKFLLPLNKTLERFEINTKNRLAFFLAQAAHESGSLNYLEEIASGAAYEGRKDLGNTQPGDGVRYKGRGIFQLTGRNNYRKAGAYLNLPLEDDPSLVSRNLEVACLTAGWFWVSRNLNFYADQGNLQAFRYVTKSINGGFNGWEDRFAQWTLINKVLGS